MSLIVLPVGLLRFRICTWLSLDLVSKNFLASRLIGDAKTLLRILFPKGVWITYAES